MSEQTNGSGVGEGACERAEQIGNRADLAMHEAFCESCRINDLIAAAANRARAEEGERIAQAIEALPYDPTRREAARIARGDA